MTRIAIAGTGRMGTAYAKRLIECGHDVTVWNRTADRTKAAAEAGASVATDVASAGRGRCHSRLADRCYGGGDRD